MSFAARQREHSFPIANDNFADKPLAPEFGEANTALTKGLALSKRGINENNKNFLRDAEKEFLTALEAAEAASPRSPDTTAFQWRININLGIILRRLGRPEEAVEKLEAIRDSLTGMPDPFLHTPRLFDTLGSANAALARKYAEDSNKKIRYENASIDAYRQAISALGRTTRTEKAERTQLRVRILSNLAATYVETDQPDLALETIQQALDLLPRVKFESALEERLCWARTLRVEADAFCLKAATYQPNVQEKARQTWELAVKTYDEALDHLGTAETDWSEITIALAIAEANLGDLLVGSDGEGGKLKASRHLFRSVRLLTESISYLEPLKGHIPILEYIQDILAQLSSLVVNLDDALTLCSACSGIFSKYNLPECRIIFATCRKILLQSIGRFSIDHGLQLTNDRLEQIKALADFIASLGVSEAEARAVVAGAFQERGWSPPYFAGTPPERSEETPHRPGTMPSDVGASWPETMRAVTKRISPPPSLPDEILKRRRIDPQAVDGTDASPPVLLPVKAPILYAERPKGQNIIDFLRDPNGWGPYVAAGVLSRPDLKRLDPKAYKAVENWLLHEPLPDDVRLPKKADLTDLAVAQHRNAAELPANVLSALRSRRTRKIKLG